MNKIYKVLPKYAFAPIIISIIFNFAVYGGSKFIVADMQKYDFSIAIDKALPFVDRMIIIYVLAYVAWIVGFIVIGRESREVCYEIMSAEQVAKILCLVCFLTIPCTLVRPEITGTGFSSWLTRLIYEIDSPENLFPSIHCLENWICFRGAMKCKKVGKTYKAVMFIAAILVFASTLLVKQHVFVDVIGGIAVVEIGLFLSKKFKMSRMYFALERKLERNERN